jgi:hypothetical protein
MADDSLLARIEALVREEHALQAQQEADAKSGEALSDDRTRLSDVSVELDRCWDLLRQRRALRSAGADPADAQTRDADTVEKYLQ